MTIVAAALLTLGCGPGNYGNDESLTGDPVGVAKEERIVADIRFTNGSPLVFSINKDQFEVYTDGRFDREFKEYYDIEITSDPEGQRCSLFDYMDDSSIVDNVFECYDSDIGFTDTNVSVGVWSYQINESMWAIYSSEENLFESDGSGGYTEIGTLNSGLFFDDDRKGETAYYAVDEVALGDAATPYQLQENLKEMMEGMPEIESVSRTYEHDAYPADSMEYRVYFSKAKSAMGAVRALAAALKKTLGAPPILQMPHINPDAPVDGAVIVGVKVYYPAGSGQHVFYQFSARTERVMKDGEHFPTLEVHTR